MRLVDVDSSFCEFGYFVGEADIAHQYVVGGVLNWFDAAYVHDYDFFMVSADEFSRHVYDLLA